ncbi:HalOD1 output domain-containing protein [Natrinema amylolyticum]|uniref:HalOD1 output domain-containing protein n=1 Tax=Natrinema amylolyticum TaxID=2878679 RepID=UPI001CFA09CC
MSASSDDNIEIEYTVQENESIPIAIAQAVSSFHQCDPLDLPPLYNSIEADTLEKLANPPDAASGSKSNIQIEFVFAECHITVENNDRIVLRPTD